jgi:Family of unknown function (DUF6516)
MIDNEIEKFKSVILDTMILTNRIDNQISEFRAKITFTNHSVLEFSEIRVFGINKRKYSFQWMNENNDLIIRWDNAFHHKHISTFPHHKHVNTESNIEASDEPTLESILLIISNSITLNQ